MQVRQLQVSEIVACDAANDCSRPGVTVSAVAVVAHGAADGCTGNEKRKGRPPVHASGAARKAAYRAAKARVDYTDAPHIIDKLRETAAQLDCSVNELLQSMVRFAETNRNWKRVGLYGSRRDGVLQ